MSARIPAWVDGQLTPVDKLEVHRKGLKHKAISVFVMDGDRTLIQKRAAGKYHTPGLWANTCCTHPDWNEPSLACANRRLEEELGITGVAPVFRDRVEYRANVGNGLIEHEVVDIFTAERVSNMPIALNPDEVEAAKWVELSKLAEDVKVAPGLYTPWLRIYLEAHMFRIFGDVSAVATA